MTVPQCSLSELNELNGNWLNDLDTASFLWLF